MLARYAGTTSIIEFPTPRGGVEMPSSSAPPGSNAKTTNLGGGQVAEPENTLSLMGQCQTGQFRGWSNEQNKLFRDGY
jgi:hypothetical protein